MFSQFISFFNEHSIIITLVSSLFGGEPAVLIMASLSAQQNIYPIWIVWIIAYSSALFGEMFWFLIARSPIIYLFGKKFSESAVHNALIKYGNKFERGKPLRLLFLTRFISGLTILVIIYLSRNKMSIKKFFGYCLLVNLFWSSVVVISGWSAGKGFTLLLNIVENIQTAISITFIVVIVVFFIYKRFARKIQSELEEKSH